jgi:hypothetical protein
VYAVDYARRTIRLFFTPRTGEIVTHARWWRDELQQDRAGIVISTDRSFHFLHADGKPAVTLPRVVEREKIGVIVVGPLDKRERYYALYLPWIPRNSFLEPEDLKRTPGYLLEYDATGREVARQTVPPPPFPTAPYAQALFGLVTPIPEAATLVGVSRWLRSEGRAHGCAQKPVLLTYLENIKYYIPGTAPDATTPGGLVPAYLALILISAAACAWVCFMLARQYAFSRARCLGWGIVGLFFGWVGLVLMLVLQDWPARVPCPKCGGLRVVTRDTCERCGALYASPAADGTEILESAATALPVLVSGE